MATRAKKHVLVLRTCNEKLQSYGGFQWPAKGPVKAPDWMPTTDCGNGLHGFLWGEGEGQLADWTETAKWLVVRVVAADVIDLGGKVKFPRGEVVFCGERTAATAYIAAHGAVGKSIVGGTSTSGYRGTSTSGYRGTSTSGDGGTSTSGDGGTSTSGYRGTSTSGYGGTSTSGDGGTSTSGDRGTSTSGDRGTSTSGYRGTSTSGYRGTSTSGVGGTSTSGEGGTIIIAQWDGAANRYRYHVAYPGENGIEPNVPYVLNECGEFVKKEAE